MTKKEIYDYVMHTPANTNPNVLRSLLNNLQTGGGGGDEGVRYTFYYDLYDEFGTLEDETGKECDFNEIGWPDLITFRLSGPNYQPTTMIATKCSVFDNISYVTPVTMLPSGGTLGCIMIYPGEAEYDDEGVYYPEAELETFPFGVPTNLPIFMINLDAHEGALVVNGKDNPFNFHDINPSLIAITTDTPREDFPSFVASMVDNNFTYVSNLVMDDSPGFIVFNPGEPSYDDEGIVTYQDYQIEFIPFEGGGSGGGSGGSTKIFEVDGWENLVYMFAEEEGNEFMDWFNNLASGVSYAQDFNLSSVPARIDLKGNWGKYTYFDLSNAIIEWGE